MRTCCVVVVNENQRAPTDPFRQGAVNAGEDAVFVR